MTARVRARDLGVRIGSHPPRPHNAITDVPGVRVGHATVDEPGSPAVHTGVTAIVPHDDIWTEPVFAGAHRLNGSGEMTGLEWIREAGELTSAIAPDQHPQRRRRARRAGLRAGPPTR